MKAIHNHGFAMLFVIVIITAVAVALFVLTDDTNTLIFQTDRAYLQAVRRNLTASGLAWAQKAGRSVDPPKTDRPITLDVLSLTAHEATLTVTLAKTTGDAGRAEVAASCTRKRRTLKSHNTYTLKP